MRDLNGNTVVAIVGGGFQNSKGMEFWNSLDGYVQLITDVIPPEIGRSSGNNDSKLESPGKAGIIPRGSYGMVWD